MGHFSFLTQATLSLTFPPKSHWKSYQFSVIAAIPSYISQCSTQKEAFLAIPFGQTSEKFTSKPKTSIFTGYIQCRNLSFKRVTECTKEYFTRFWNVKLHYTVLNKLFVTLINAISYSCTNTDTLSIPSICKLRKVSLLFFIKWSVQILPLKKLHFHLVNVPWKEDVTAL